MKKSAKKVLKRQGDLLLVKIEMIPEGALKQNHRVLAEGEATGHLHELDTGELYEKDGTLFFSVPDLSTATLNHPEHGAVTFDPGVYQVVRQREYSPKDWKGWAYVRD